MRIFLSWSGVRSKAMAVALREWLPQVVQAFDPFMSEEDIKKGERGFAVLSEQLGASKHGVLCITPENREQPWIMFEAGAIGKSVDGRVNALLLDLEPGELHAALGQFQVTRFDQEDVFRLVCSLNEDLGADQLPKDRLRKGFDKWWPDLEKEIEAARKLPAPAAPPKRKVEEIATETLDVVRQLARDVATLRWRANTRRPDLRAPANEAGAGAALTVKALMAEMERKVAKDLVAGAPVIRQHLSEAFEALSDVEARAKSDLESKPEE